MKLEDEIYRLKTKAISDNSALVALRSELQGKTAQLQETQAELQETRRTWRRHIKTLIPRWMILTVIV